MSLEQNKQVALESLRVLETGDTAAAERIIAPDFINHEADDPDRSDRGIRGPAGLSPPAVGCARSFRSLDLIS